jgi:hypothetical protein
MEGYAMTFKISFPDQPAAEAGVLAQELRLGLLRSGADPSTVEIIKERVDTMDLGGVVQIALEVYHAARPMLDYVPPLLTAATCARTLYNICAPAHSGIRITTPRGTVVEINPGEVSFDRLKQIFDATESDAYGG